MTTYFQYQENNSSNFQFQPTLDGQVYNAVVTYNIFGKRNYLTITDLRNNLIFSLPVIGSPDGFDISISAGYFTTKIIFRTSSNQFEII